MRNIFYSILFLAITGNSFAQTPGGLPNSVLWLKADLGGSPSNWLDNSSSANNFLQGNPVNQPTLSTNVFNFNPALSFDGANRFMDQPSPSNFPGGNADRTILIVANASNTPGYRWIFTYGSPGTPNATFQMGNHDGDLVNAYFASPDDLSYPGYWNNAANQNGGLASFTMAGNVQSQYDKGIFIQNNLIGSTLNATSANASIGSLPGFGEYWQGNIAEVIMFNTALSDAERNQVESYLALKYGLTLGAPGSAINYVASDGSTTYWTGMDTWQNDVFGIGTDAGTGFQQIQSNSMNSGTGTGAGQYAKGNLVLSAASLLTNGQFLMIGNDAGDLSEQSIGLTEAPPEAVGSTRLMRNWRAQNTGAVGPVNLSFDTVGLTLTGKLPGDFRLMVDTDGDNDYSTGTSFIAPSSITGNLVNFTGISLPTNARFTLITQASALLPATWQGFSVTADRNKATLVWKTSDEINVDHYTAEYSSDGTIYKTVGTVTANNRPGTNTYSIVQDNLPVGTRYYRIKRVDKDGRFELSTVKTIKIVGATTVSLRTNPVTTSRLELTIDVQQSQNAIIRIITTDGKILVQQNSALSGGTNSISTSITGVAHGAYLLQVQLGSQVINKKFVRM